MRQKATKRIVVVVIMTIASNPYLDLLATNNPVRYRSSARPWPFRECFGTLNGCEAYQRTNQLKDVNFNRQKQKQKQMKINYDEKDSETAWLECEFGILHGGFPRSHKENGCLRNVRRNTCGSGFL